VHNWQQPRALARNKTLHHWQEDAKAPDEDAGPAAACCGDAVAHRAAFIRSIPLRLPALRNGQLNRTHARQHTHAILGNEYISYCYRP
jgi:hypothetical protein